MKELNSKQRAIAQPVFEIVRDVCRATGEPASLLDRVPRHPRARLPFVRCLRGHLPGLLAHHQSDVFRRLRVQGVSTKEHATKQRRAKH